MTREELASLSPAGLRDRLKARADELDHTDDVDLMAVLRHLTTLPDQAHTPESVDALIQLARNFFYAAQPQQTIDAAALASKLARALNHQLLRCEARGLEGVALSDVGRFTESTMAHAESWMLTRELGATEREIFAIVRVGILCSAMAHWDVAMSFFGRARELAAKHGFSNLEAEARNNFANCALQLRDPATGLRALLPLRADVPNTRRQAMGHANAHDTLAHLYLISGDMDNAKHHARESGRFVRLGGTKRTVQLHKALVGLIEARSGEVQRGLAAVERALKFAKRVSNSDVPDYLSMCVDACEAAGQSEKALGYLQQLVAWKSKLIDAEMPQHEGLTASFQSQESISVFDDNLRVRAQLLQADVQQRIRRFVETAINAEIASGHDLYRTFRMANLSRCLALEIGWDEERVVCLTLGAQLCNIGMMAIPARILQKPRSLSESERHVMRTHTQYGAELLRKSQLRTLATAGTIAEQHHERHDGTGYPRGMRGQAIAEEARIVAICDAFDAMTHRRPWRKTPLSIQTALNELKHGAGSQFDPPLVDAFVDLARREFSKYDHLDAFLAEGADDVEYVRIRARMEAMIAGGDELHEQAA